MTWMTLGSFEDIQQDVTQNKQHQFQFYTPGILTALTNQSKSNMWQEGGILIWYKLEQFNF